MDEQQQQPHPEGGSTRRGRALIGTAAVSAVLVGGGLALGTLGGSPASAAQSGDETTTTTAEDTATTEDTGTTEHTGTDAGECGPGRRGGRFVGRLIGLTVAADTIGITTDELRDALREGSSIADVAEENGVDAQTVIEALVTEATEAIDQRVADGELDAEVAAELQANLEERITDKVNAEGGFPHGRRGEVEADEDTDATTES
jgi:hypothetical protein